ncbi:MAG: hypothetical protein IJB96_03835 [Lachnospira sp.]|nr:hypothetical protein [Lachnospira sp.]
MVVQHNLSASNASRRYKAVVRDTQKNSEKLSSGYRINRAADDAAGLSISEKMRYMIRGLGKASKNAEDGISLLQTAEGALGEMHSVMHRMRELAVQAANDTNTSVDRQALQKEIDNLISEIDKIADDTEFNTMKLLNGNLAEGSSAASPIVYQGLTGIEGLQSITVADPIVGEGVALNATQTANVNDVLVNSIVPQAVNSFLNTFSVFNSAATNGQISNQIGLKLYGDSSTTLAYVSIKYGYYGDGTIAPDLVQLNLSVNTNALAFDGDSLTAESRTALETTIVHEMMHAFMDDTLINGMIGANNGVLDSANQYPGWFKEGMAQTASGGCANNNDWVNSGLGLTTASTVDQISATIRSGGNSLASGTTQSKYATGYLASMYLGYMAAGSPSTITSAELAGGLNTVLQKMVDGASLDDVIVDVSNGSYTSLADFEAKFGDSDSSQFVYALLNAVGSAGNGGVVGALTTSDLLPDADTTSAVYGVDDTSEYVVSSVGNNRNWNSGGAGGISLSNGTGGGAGGGGTGGSAGGPLGALKLQIGALEGQGMGVTIEDMHASVLGVEGMSVMSHTLAGNTISACDVAIEKISATRSKIGAYVNRLEHTIANVDNTAENTQAAESRIRDTDMAEMMVEYSKNNILTQAAQAMISQAKATPESVLNLL